MRQAAALALAAVSLTACSGEDGQRAQRLLSRAQTAQAQLVSAGYEVRMTFSVDGRQFGLVMDGGAYMKGARAGDQLLTMRTENVPGVGLNMRMLLRRGTLTMSINGRNTTIAVPQSARQQYDWSGAMIDLARYVKHVKVREGRVVNGERGVTVAGVIDTEGLLKAATRLAGFSRAAGPAAPDMGELAEAMDDTRIAAFIATRTGLIRSAVITLGMESDGKKADVELTYRLKSVNRAIPGL